MKLIIYSDWNAVRYLLYFVNSFSEVIIMGSYVTSYVFFSDFYFLT